MYTHSDIILAGGVKMDLLKEFEMQPFVKYIVIKVDIFGSEIIDEKNFGIDEEFEIMRFRKKYIGMNNCVIVKVGM